MTGAVVYVGGVRWSDTPGTDRRLATALATSCSVTWVEPVRSVLRPAAPVSHQPEVRGVTAVEVVGPPGVTRIGVRDVAARMQARRVRALANTSDVAGIVVATPLTRLPRMAGVRTLLHVTDDWVAGSELMGLSRRWVAKQESRLVADADVVTAVSPHLAEILHERHRREIGVLPNGCQPVDMAAVTDRPSGGAALVGQINERTDLEYLESVASLGVPLTIVGPVTARSGAFLRRWTQLLAAPSVRWLGARHSGEISQILANASVGLTPYAQNDFNRASFPLKTLEYLAHGVPAVSTPLPSLEWLEGSPVDVASDASTFAERVRNRTDHPLTAASRAQLVEYSRQHSWTARAQQLLTLLAPGLHAPLQTTQ